MGVDVLVYVDELGERGPPGSHPAVPMRGVSPLHASDKVFRSTGT